MVLVPLQLRVVVPEVSRILFLCKLNVAVFTLSGFLVLLESKLIHELVHLVVSPFEHLDVVKSE
jgi:hypothetical protein